MVSFFCHDSNENYHVYLSQKKNILEQFNYIFFFFFFFGGGGGLAFIHKEDTCKNK